jgi:hypothetical protein
MKHWLRFEFAISFKILHPLIISCYRYTYGTLVQIHLSISVFSFLSPFFHSTKRPNTPAILLDFLFEQAVLLDLRVLLISHLRD